MSFTSPLFIFVFLPIVIAAHSLVPGRLRNPLLLISSMLYYFITDIPHTLPIICFITVNFFVGKLAYCRITPDRQRFYLLCTVVFNVLVLIYFKYSLFIAETVSAVAGWPWLSAGSVRATSAPLGLSFIVFQIIAYHVDCSNETTEPQSSFTRFALFALLFPKITAGPIIRHTEVDEALCSRTVSLDEFVYGLKRFILGLSKKVLIADVLAKTVNPAFLLPQNELTAGAAWFVILCFSLQCYYDFSGYSDMAIGIGRMLGFTFRENFDRPYCASSLTDFWRRWHISLSTWLRDYLFIPLNYALITERVRINIASGRSKAKHLSAVCILMVFTVCGLWHGAAWTFVVWGIFHGLILAMENLGFAKIIKSWWRPFQHGYTLVILMVTWVFFRSPSLDYALGYLKSMLPVLVGNGGSHTALAHTVTRETLLILGVAILFVLPVQERITELCSKYSFSKVDLQSGNKLNLIYGVSYISYMALLLLCVVSLSGTTYNPFLYGKF